jgi:predicted PhzF superfamily epimerase YddE/YHI9
MEMCVHATVAATVLRGRDARVQTPLGVREVRVDGDRAVVEQFPLRAGFDEDTATGVAACALGAHLAGQAGPTAGWHRFTIAQGRAMGRPSLIEAEAQRDATGAVVATRVGGTSVALGAAEPLED